jgi:hypothetical protein
MLFGEVVLAATRLTRAGCANKVIEKPFRLYVFYHTPTTKLDAKFKPN